jgi:hypothetical protein
VTMTIQQAYFRWLYSLCFKILDTDSPLSYSMVCTHLHEMEFTPMVPNDDNRAIEGAALREEFIDILNGMTVDAYAELHALGPATLLEMLIALSRHASFISQHDPDIWFRKFLDNLGLLGYSDDVYRPRDIVSIRQILRRFNARQYTRSGRGGIFPLRGRPRRDQRRIEIWYQMSEYMRENHMY